MENAYPDRKFLHLIDSSAEADLVKDVLKSPLGLASDVIKRLFEEKAAAKQKPLNSLTSDGPLSISG